MGIFRRKKRDVLDLNERYKKQQEKLVQMKSSESECSSNSGYGTESGMGFFANMANASKQNSNENDYADLTNSSSMNSSNGDGFSGFEDKRKKLAKRLMDMTDKLEELSNQIYHLTQRIEVLEKRLR